MNLKTQQHVLKRREHCRHSNRSVPGDLQYLEAYTACWGVDSGGFVGMTYPGLSIPTACSAAMAPGMLALKVRPYSNSGCSTSQYLPIKKCQRRPTASNFK